MKRVYVRLRWAPDDEIAVGSLAEARRGRIFFEFDPAFLGRGIEVSPWKLRAERGLLEHTDRAFGGLFGVFDDSLPDGWGLLLMDRWFRRQRIDPGSVSALDRLLHLGTRTMGALTYHPPTEPPAEPVELDLSRLAAEASRVMQGSEDDVLPELLRVGGSPGGARPKVLVGVRGPEILSGEDDLPDGWEHWLVKFTSTADELVDGAVEHAYMGMAQAAGVDVPAHRLFARGRFFGARRFDRAPENRRLHMHTLGGLIHADFRVPSCDYDQLLRVTRGLTHDHRVVVECFRRMVFNIASHNRDDHVKNFAFLMDARGEWQLSPAYDLVFSRGPGGEHTMTIDGEGREPTLAGVLALGQRHGIGRAEAMEIVDVVQDAVASWPTIAKRSGCDRKRVGAIGREHRRLG